MRLTPRAKTSLMPANNNMTRTSFKSLCALAALAGAVFFVGGCASAPKPKARTIVFRKTAEVKEKVAVDIVAVSKGDIDGWKGLTITNYFTLNNPRRTQARENGLLVEKGWALTKNGDQELKLSRDDKQWEGWFRKGAKYLVVLADLPRNTMDTPDAWRKEIDLADTDYNGRATQVVVEISPSGVSVRPEKP